MKAEAGLLLHVRGEHSEGTLRGRLEAKGFRVRSEILYVVEPRPLPQAAADALRADQVDAALFFSPRSARIFAEQTDGLSLAHVAAFCISAATAKALPEGRFGAVHVAAKPTRTRCWPCCPEPLTRRLQQGDTILSCNSLCVFPHTQEFLAGAAAFPRRRRARLERRGWRPSPGACRPHHPPAHRVARYGASPFAALPAKRGA